MQCRTAARRPRLVRGSARREQSRRCSELLMLTCQVEGTVAINIGAVGRGACGKKDLDTVKMALLRRDVKRHCATTTLRLLRRRPRAQHEARTLRVIVRTRRV